MLILHLMAVLAAIIPNARDRHGRARRVRMIPATISTMLSTTSPVTAPPKISAGARVDLWRGRAAGEHPVRALHAHPQRVGA